MYRLIIFLLFLVSYPAYSAISLFGVDLLQATRDEMRSAVRKPGAKLIREAGREGFYDEFGSEKLLQGSSKLYLGYVKKDNQLAFVEYQFEGFHHPELILKITEKYGKPRTIKGKFQSDSRYQWLIDGVQILIYQDWAVYKTRLVYFLPQKLSALRLEYQKSNAQMLSVQDKDSELVY
jgi:hypothetical protein